MNRQTRKITISISARAGSRYTPFVLRKLRAAHRLLKSPLRELSVAFVGDARMSLLHEQFMGIPGPTDVLTFPLDTDPSGQPLSGEVIVCIPEALRQARRHKTAPANEVLLYALHGLLHLSGFDDRTKADFAEMHRMEDHILTQLGVGHVFDPGRSPGKKRRATTGTD